MCYYICVTDNIIQYKGDQAIGNEDSRYGNRGNNKDRVLINEKIRSTQQPTEVVVTRNGDNVHVKFDDMQKAIAVGQSVVFYDDDILLGGGVIAQVE